MAANTAHRSPHHAGSTSLNFHKEAKQMTIKPKDLNIVWGGDSRYWSVPDSDEQPAVLNQVYWLEVTGCVDGIESHKQYEVVFRVSLTPDAFGFGGSPLYVMVKRGKDGEFVWSKLTPKPDAKEIFAISGKLTKPKPGQNQCQDQSKLYFGLYEVWSGKWKGGLRIHQVIINELPN